MNDAVVQMLKNFGDIEDTRDKENALREIIQKITLHGLYRSQFFENAAFYGGTALRILYGLNRISEDMDFCLNAPDESFALAPYFEGIKQELERFGFNATISEKKTGPETVIESAFVKQSTYQGIIVLGKDPKNIHRNQLIKIRLEVDKQNPSGGLREKKLIKLPLPFLVTTLTLPSLFAGKLHAIIARSYLNRVKGRDYYDLQYYLARDVPVNLVYLEAKLRDSGHYNDGTKLSIEKVVELLVNKFKTVDFEKAKQDVEPFLHTKDLIQLQSWSAELFTALIQELEPELK